MSNRKLDNIIMDKRKELGLPPLKVTDVDLEDLHSFIVENGASNDDIMRRYLIEPRRFYKWTTPLAVGKYAQFRDTIIEARKEMIDKHIKELEVSLLKRAKGYYVEEVETVVVKDPDGVVKETIEKKKSKYLPPDLKAITYYLGYNSKQYSSKLMPTHNTFIQNNVSIEATNTTNNNQNPYTIVVQSTGDTKKIEDITNYADRNNDAILELDTTEEKI